MKGFRFTLWLTALKKTAIPARRIIHDMVLASGERLRRFLYDLKMLNSLSYFKD